ncbi:MAG: complex I subunit 1 family protein [Planctomycetota bacterium]
MVFVYFLASVLIVLVLGLATSWIDRKVTALVQARVGPPWYQPLADIAKLLGKETLLPGEGRAMGFLAAPLAALATAGVAGAILVGSLLAGRDFVGDLVVLLYFFTLPAAALILGACASGNPVSVVGASREMKMMLAYELPLLIVMVTLFLRAGGVFRIDNLLAFQAEHGWMLWSFSGAAGFIVALLCTQAKLGLVPFDAPEAEQELMGGVLCEYSGAPLAVWKLTRAMLLCLFCIFLGVAFLGGFSLDGWGVLWSALKYVAILVPLVLIRNTNPRLRIDQILRFFWGPMTVLAIAGLLLAVRGW